MSGLAATDQAVRNAPAVTTARIRWLVRAEYLRNSYGGRFVLVVSAYYAAAHLGYAFRFAGPVASVVWLPAGVGIAGLYLLGLRLWPAVVVGDLLVNNYSALPVGAAIGQSFGNLLEIVIGAALLRRLASRKDPLATTPAVAGLLAALAAGTIVSASVGSISLTLGRVISAGSIPHVWMTWWLGDFCGAIIVVSVALAVTSSSPTPRLRGHVFEAVLVFVTLVVLSTIGIQAGHDLSYLALPALVWAGLRFGPRGATLAIVVASAFTIWGATNFFGTFFERPFPSSLLYIQLYLAVTAASALAVAALASERELLAQNVRASRTRIVFAADEARRRLEHNLHDGAQQRLLALSVRLGRAARQAPDGPESAARTFEAAQAEVLEAIEELRELVHGIRPAVLRRLGLARAVEAVAARSATKVEILELPEVRLDETAETTAYYVVLEAVTNAERHARASRIYVAARLARQSLELAVDDDGVGGASERGELGLQGLRDRVEATGGSFSVVSEAGRGTRIRADIPATVVSGDRF
jgi:signal transduction histidine kinase